MSTIFYRLLKIALSITVIFIALVAWVITTHTGTATAFRVAQLFLSDKLSIAKIEGRLLDSLTIHKLHYQSTSLKLQIDDATLNWHALSLLKRKLSINQLEVNNLTVTITADKTQQPTHAPEKPKKSSFWLPSAIHIDQLNLINIRFQNAAQKPLVIKNITGHIVFTANIAVAIKTELIAPVAATAALKATGSVEHYQWIFSLTHQQNHWLADGVGDRSKVVLKAMTGQILGGRLSGAGKLSWAPTFNWQLTAQADSLNLKPLHTAMPDHLSFSLETAGNPNDFTIDIKGLTAVVKKLVLKGFFYLQLTATDPTSKPQAFSNFKINTALTLGNNSCNIKGFALDRWNIQYALRFSDLHALDSTLLGEANLVGSIQGPYATPKLNSQIFVKQLNYAQLPLLENFKGELNLTGAWPDFKLQNLDFNSESLLIPKVQLQLNKLNIHATAQNDQINYIASVLSDKNRLQLQGTSFIKENGFNSSLLLQAQNFLVSDTPQLKIYISPELRIENQLNDWYISGKIAIPTAEIKLPDIAKTVALPAETTVITSSNSTIQKNQSNLFTDILLEIGNKVHIKTSGLDSFIAGKLKIMDSPGKDTLANGQLNFKEGSYDLKGQTLKLEQSNLSFNNTTIDNPNLNIRATKLINYTASEQTLAQNQAFVVGLLVTGTAENPNITLFSDPAGWSQPDILSLILFGKPVDTISGSSFQLLATAANSLTPQSGGGINHITQQMQQAFGLTEFGLESGVSQNAGESKTSTSFVLGKYLTPRLYLNYSLGVFDAVNTLRLRYTLTKHWFIQTQSNLLGSGVDIFYSIAH